MESSSPQPGAAAAAPAPPRWRAGAGAAPLAQPRWHAGALAQPRWRGPAGALARWRGPAGGPRWHAGALARRPPLARWHAGALARGCQRRWRAPSGAGAAPAALARPQRDFFATEDLEGVLWRAGARLTLHTTHQPYGTQLWCHAMGRWTHPIWQSAGSVRDTEKHCCRGPVQICSGWGDSARGNLEPEI
jgi:hypothetical protein